MLLDCIKFDFGVHLFRHIHSEINGKIKEKNLPVVGDQCANKLLKFANT
jgi:hypothetical protein